MRSVEVVILLSLAVGVLTLKYWHCKNELACETPNFTLVPLDSKLNKKEIEGNCGIFSIFSFAQFQIILGSKINL
jgi:hypothetical protein